MPQERDPVRKCLSFKRDQLLKHPIPTEPVIYTIKYREAYIIKLVSIHSSHEFYTGQ